MRLPRCSRQERTPVPGEDNHSPIRDPAGISSATTRKNASALKHIEWKNTAERPTKFKFASQDCWFSLQLMGWASHPPTQGNRVKPIKSFLRTVVALWIMFARRSVLLSKIRLKNRST